MRYFIIFIFTGISLLHLPSWAQRDQIVTQAGQEIRCKILEESPNRFTYAFLDPTGKVKQSQIFKSLVKSFAYQMYDEDVSQDKIFKSSKKETEVSRFEAPKPKPDPAPAKSTKKPKPLSPKKPTKVVPDPQIGKTKFSGWQVGIRGGLANYTAPLQGLSETSLPYYENLARGYSVGTEIHYYLSKFIGFGIIATGTHSEGLGTNVQYYNGFANTFLVNDLQTTRQILYVGPSVSFRHILDPKAMIYARLSGGQFLQHDAGFYAITPYEGKGQDWGGSAAVGFDFLLGKSSKKNGLAFNLEGSYFYLQQNQLNFGEGNRVLPSPLDLNHFAITLGIKWTKFPHKD